MCSKIYLLCVILASVSLAKGTIVSKCTSGPDAILVKIEGCDKEPCTLSGVAVMDITFKAPINTYTLVPKVRAKVGPITVTYPLQGEQADACNSITNGYCPIEKDEILTYHLEMLVSPFPKIDVNLEFSLIGDNETVFQCFKVDCIIAD